MEITDKEKARVYLARIGYYRLSAYWYPNWEFESYTDLEDNREKQRPLDKFQKDTTFSSALDFYIFDKKLRLIVLDALERVEIGIRAEIVARLGARNPLAHRDSAELHENFSHRLENADIPRSKHEEWLESLDGKFQRTKEPFIEHFKMRYRNEHPPIWIAAELWDFGMLSRFFGGMTFSDRDSIAAKYELPSAQILGTWIRKLNDIRNLCAHHSRLWNRNLSHRRPKWPRVGTVPNLDHVQPASLNRLYASVVMLAWLLKTINPSTSWRNRLINHVETLPDNPCVTLASAGFPEDWTQQRLWAV